MPTTSSTGKRRFVFSIGDVGMPAATAASSSNRAHSSSPQLGKHLAALIDASEAMGAASTGPTYGIELLRIASTGASAATLGAHPSFQHVSLLDQYVRLQGHSGTSVNIVKAASGRYHSLLLLSLGQLLLASPDPCENGTAVTLGTTSQDDAAATGVQDVAAGRSHFVVCTDSGSVYTFGWSNEYGQLGDGTVWRVDHQGAGASNAPPLLTDPKRIPGFGISSSSNTDTALGAPPTPLIIAVAAGDNHSVLLAASKTAVYTCGRGHRGQLGTCRKVDLSTTFHVVQKLFGLWTSAIAAAADHTILLLDTGKLVAFGDNTTGAACTGASQCALEPHEATWALEDGNSSVASAVPSKEKQPIAAAESTTTTMRRAVDNKAMESIKAPYGSVESYLYPRRIFRFPAAVVGEEGKKSGSGAAKVVDSVVTSSTLTIATTVDQELFTSGLRVSVDPVKQRADGRGHLGRHTPSSQSARQLGQVSLRRCSTSAEGGWKAVCGQGFAAYWDSAAGVVRVHGTIGGGSAAAAVSSLDPAHVATYQSPADDSIPLEVGAKRRVVSVVAVQRGLLLVVEE